MKVRGEFLFHLAAVVTIAVWGTTFVSTKVLINDGLSPTEIFTYRFAIAYVGIWLWELFSYLQHYLRRSHSPSLSPSHKLFAANVKDELLMAAVGLTGGSLYFIAENTALETTLAGNVSLLVCTAPILTAMISRLFYPKEKTGANLWVGTAVALVGAAAVIFNGKFVLEVNPVGDVLALVAAFSWAVYSLVIRRLSKRYSTLFITRKVFFYGLVTLIPFLLLPGAHYHPEALVRSAVWGNLLFWGVVASLACFVVWNLVMARIGVVTSSNYIYLNPVFTMLAAWLVLGEKITPIAVGGFVLIAAGLAITDNRWNSRKKNITLQG